MIDRATVVAGLFGAGMACGAGTPATDGGNPDGADDAVAPDASVPVVLAEVASGEAYQVTVANGVVYWLDGGLPVAGSNGKAMRVNVDGSDQRMLAEGLDQPLSPLVNAGTLHWLEGDGGIMAVAVDGGSAATELANDGVGPLALAADADYLYWVVHLNPTGRVARMPAQGGTMEDVATAQPDPARIAVSGATAYFALQSELRQVPVAGGTVDWFASATYATALLIADGHVYWRAGDTGAFTIGRRAADGASNAEPVASIGRGAGLAVDTEFVYYGEDDDGLGGSPTSIWRKARDGSGAPQLVHDELPYVATLVQEGAYLYAATGGSILKLPK